MNIIGIGTDIVEVSRVRDISFFERVAEFVFLKEELMDLHASTDPIRFFASRFAVKEAIIKAYPGTLTYHDVKLSKLGVKPVASFVRDEDQSYHAFVSLAHEREYAIGYATVCQ